MNYFISPCSSPHMVFRLVVISLHLGMKETLCGPRWTLKILLIPDVFKKKKGTVNMNAVICI